ncbi:hypothetical protein ACFE04_013453 [Oxalis oulophora]
MLESIKYILGLAGASGFGSKTTAEQVTENCPDLSSITALITGATSGIGAETARVIAKRGARLVLPARNLKAAEEAKARIMSECPNTEIIVMSLDLSSINSVNNFVKEFQSLNLPLNLLINNAGKFAHEHAISEDGIEMTFATNYLGDMIRYLGQISRQKCHYDPTRAYALSKLANVLHTKELARRLKKMEVNVTANCVHPGIVRTRLTREREGLLTDIAFFLASKLVKTIPQAAATSCYVATNPRLLNVSGKYYADCNEAWSSNSSTDHQASRVLWSASDIMVSKHSKLNFHPFAKEFY